MLVKQRLKLATASYIAGPHTCCPCVAGWETDLLYAHSARDGEGVGRVAGGGCLCDGGSIWHHPDFSMAGISRVVGLMLMLLTECVAVSSTVIMAWVARFTRWLAAAASCMHTQAAATRMPCSAAHYATSTGTCVCCVVSHFAGAD